jgi:hypothetical protein
MAARTDPVLSAQLREAAAGEEPVQAVIGLREEGEGAGDGDAVTALTEDLLARVKEQTGAEAHDYNVFRNLGSFAVVAPARFIQALIEQPEVESAIANRQPEAVVEPLGRPAPD